jgi:hypothetical protein
MTNEVIDHETGEPVDDESIPFATLEDLTEPPKPKTVVIQTGNGQRRVTYIPYLSVDKLAAIQAKHRPKGRRGEIDAAGFMMDIVEACLITPRVKTPKQLRALRKGGSGSFVTNLMNEVVDTEFFEEIKDDLGEA